MKLINGFKRKIKMASAIVVGTFLFSSCATIIGGSKYYAHVRVEKHPNASISYKGEVKGNGYIVFQAPRREADMFSIVVKEENCEEQTFNFKGISFRGWALVGTIVCWTVSINGIPIIPLGVVLDGMTGAFWKPDITEKGVFKTDYKNYNYELDYTGCKQQDNNIVIIKTPIKNKAERLGELIYKFNNGLLSQEEFEKEKKKILEE